MNITMKIILHIGNYKTGTSALQNFLYKNRQKLMEYGIYYGNTWKVTNNHAGLALGILKEALEEYGLLNCCSDLEELEENPDVTASKIRFIAESRGAKTIIISHEGFFGDLLQVSSGLDCCPGRDNIDVVNKFVRKRLKELFPEAEVVCYLRRQDLYIESMYMEYCKVPWRGYEVPVEFNRFMARQRLCLDYFREISGWKEAFRENVFFKVYEKERLLNNDIIYDFLCCFAGLGIQDINKLDGSNISESNVSLSRDALEHKLAYKINEPVLNYLYKVYSGYYPDSVKYGFMQQYERESFIRQYSGGNKMLFGEEGFGSAVVPAAYPGLTEEKSREISHCIKEMAGLWEFEN